MAGARPSFDDVHLVRALLAMENGPVSRKTLVKILGVGEGSVRTILGRLSDGRLVESAKSGHTLNDAGAQKVGGILKKISRPAIVELPELSGSGGQIMAVVYKAAGKVRSVVALRDKALKAGADGALILVCDGGKLRYPGDGMSRRVPVISNASAEDGDVVVVGFAENREKAEDGALAVSLELSGVRV